MKLTFRDTALGRIGIAEEHGSITNLFFESCDAIPQNVDSCETAVIREAFRQLEAFLAGKLQSFSLPFAPSGTEFMRAVWNCLAAIPYGTTASYKEIAIAAGTPKACRAVGLANNKNPIPIFIPCHRIIGTDGRLVGYRGGLEIKKVLLDLEQHHKTA
jgi:methylated-DNA-[protein]-cysteine S-methyltransferase